MQRALRRLPGIFLLSLWLGTAHGEFGPEEPLLYPGGFSTADVLRKHEWVLAPPPVGWVAYGATRHLTLAWDYPAALFGYPAGLVRYQLGSEGSDVHYALELYGVIWTKDNIDSRSPGYLLEHRGGQGWIRLAQTWRLSKAWRWHLYGGANYAAYERYSPNTKLQFPPLTYRNDKTLDLGGALEWDVRPRMKIHLNYVYGNTFVFVDQVPRKYMVVGTLHFAPFSSRRTAILRNLRFDLNALYVDVPPAHYHQVLPFPIFPTLYWQWGGTSKKDNH